MFCQSSKRMFLGVLIAFLLAAMPAYGVRDFKVSDYGGGHQVWFEAEAYDERNPDTDQYYPVVDEAGAFGQAITRAGGAGGRISWTFNIAAADGTAGTWYFWGRVINPSNQSDFMVVEGHPGDQIPGGPPFPGTSSAAEFSDGQRVFEENIGSPGNWAWGRTGHGEAHTKELQDALNTMHIYHRQGNDTVFWDVFMWTDDPGYVPTDDDYLNARPGGGYGPASAPDPQDGALVADTWVSLLWRAGDFAVSHDVYLGESLDDVNDGAAETYRGNVGTNNFVAGFPGYPYPDGLVPGTTYYWRIDEVNDADPNSPWRGDVWSFWVPPTNAYDPVPSDGAKYVDLDAMLTWQPGFGAKLHNIVFGETFDEVDSAPAGSPSGNTKYTPGALEAGKTYYWRVDEFNPPATVKGNIWSFSTLPDIPITDPNLVAWYKFEAGSGAKVVDFSGHGNFGDIIGEVPWVPGQFNLALEFLGDDFGHVEMPAGIVDTTSGSIAMWIKTDLTDDEGMFWYGTETNGDGFGDQLEIHIHVDDPGVLGFWIEGTTDVGLGGPQIAGAGWNHVAATWDLADGCRLYFNGAEVDFQTHNNTVAALSAIRLGRPVDTGNGNRYYDGLMDDVRLFDHPITPAQVNEIMTKGEEPRRAGAPSPRNGSLAAVNVATPLTWSAGEGASQHDVYFGMDQAAVANADASDTTGVYVGRENATSYTPDGITMGSGPFYWRIDEVAGDGTIVAGGVWSFSVADYALVEDFESYNDIPAGEPGSNLVYIAWVDGFDNPNVNGSTMGYVTGASLESGNVHGGSRSVPFQYNNATASVSEVVRTFASAQDWTAHGAITLSLWFAGDAANAPGQLYVKVNGVQVNYDGAINNLTLAPWQVWNIDLTAVNTNLSSVRSLAIGVQGAGATGTLLLDDIRLYARPRELVTPVQPDDASLLLHLALDEGFGSTAGDSSGKGRNGTISGATWRAGGYNGLGSSLEFGGDGDHVVAADTAYLNGLNSITISVWVKSDVTDTDKGFLIFQDPIGDDNNGMRYDAAGATAGGTNLLKMSVVSTAGNQQLESSDNLQTTEWQHCAMVWSSGEQLTFYVNGRSDSPSANSAATIGVTTGFEKLLLGKGGKDQAASDGWDGLIDDLRIYDRALSDAEVAGLAGLTQPYDRPL